MNNRHIPPFFSEDKVAIVFSLLILITQIYFIFTGFLSISVLIAPVCALLFLMSVIYIQSKSDSKKLKFVRSYIHIPLYGIIFSSFQTFVHKLNPNDCDILLLKIDLDVFGFDITRWFENYVTKGLTEILTLSYFSYYVLPTLTFTLLFFLKDTDSYTKTRNYLLSIVIGWYAAFIFYLVLPAAGPDIAFPGHFTIPLIGLTPLTNSYLQNLSEYLRESFVRNTFPSMHFGIILITNYFAYRYRRKYFWFCTLPLGIMLGIATVYLRQHYLIDLAGSFPIAIASIYVALKLNKPLQTKQED